MCVCVCVRARVCVCVCVRVCAMCYSTVGRPRTGGSHAQPSLDRSYLQHVLLYYSQCTVESPYIHWYAVLSEILASSALCSSAPDSTVAQRDRKRSHSRYVTCRHVQAVYLRVMPDIGQRSKTHVHARTHTHIRHHLSFSLSHTCIKHKRTSPCCLSINHRLSHQRSAHRRKKTTKIEFLQLKNRISNYCSGGQVIKMKNSTGPSNPGTGLH